MKQDPTSAQQIETCKLTGEKREYLSQSPVSAGLSRSNHPVQWYEAESPRRE